jgi:hypothetical protein
METVTSDSQKNLILQQLNRGSTNQNKESNLKVNLNTNENDVQNKQPYWTNDRKPLIIYHQNIRGLRGKADELIGHLHPVLLHISRFMEHHMN